MTVAQLIDLCAVDDVPQRGALKFMVVDTPIAVFRTGDDAIFALVDRCPHKGGPLSDGIVVGRAVACPLHNWLISLETGEACGADEGCAQKLEVSVAAGRIKIGVDGIRTF